MCERGLGGRVGAAFFPPGRFVGNSTEGRRGGGRVAEGGAGEAAVAKIKEAILAVTGS